MLVGIAFGNSGTHLPHAMSYGITHLMTNITTAGYPVKDPFVPHGISVIVTAPAIFRYTAEATPIRHLESARFLGADLENLYSCAQSALVKSILGFIASRVVDRHVSKHHLDIAERIGQRKTICTRTSQYSTGTFRFL